MNATELLAELGRQGVELSLDGDRLRYRVPAGALGPELRAAVVEQRSAIIAALRSPQATSPHGGPCSRCDTRDRQDEPPKDGRIRTTCGRCGRFIGYRPAQPGQFRN